MFAVPQPQQLTACAGCQEAVRHAAGHHKPPGAGVSTSVAMSVSVRVFIALVASAHHCTSLSGGGVNSGGTWGPNLPEGLKGLHAEPHCLEHFLHGAEGADGAGCCVEIEGCYVEAGYIERCQKPYIYNQTDTETRNTTAWLPA
jgi:hypothetical protein